MPERALYVYGLVGSEDSAALPDGAPGIEDRSEVRTVEETGLVVLVSDVDPGAVERGVRLAEGGDLAWLERAARDHERVLHGAIDAGALLPFRFGVVVAGADDVRSLLRRRGDDFRAALEAVRGAREWGVKALLDTARLGDAVAADDPTLAEVGGAEGGRAFFARKRFERDLAERVRAAAAELAATAHDRLAACARDSVANPPQPRQLSGYDDEMILNGAYLVDRTREGDLRAAVAALEAELEPGALRFELTGPWPAFNFVQHVAEHVA